MLHLGVKKEPRPDAVKQRPEADKLGLSVKRNPQKIPAAHGGTTDAPFDALLPVEVGFISERVKIPADPRRVVQRHIGANIVLCGMNHLTAPRHEGRQPAPYGDPAGELDVISPDEEFLYGKPEAAYGFRAQEQRHKGGLFGLYQSVLQQRKVFMAAFFQLLPVHLAVAAVRPHSNAAEPAVASLQNFVRFQQLLQGIRLGQGVIVHDPDIVIARFHRPAHSIVEATRAAQIAAGVPAGQIRLGGQPPGSSVGAGIVHDQDIAGCRLVSQRLHTLPQQLQPVIGHHHCRCPVLFFHMHHPQLRVESACAYSTFGWNLSPRKKPFQITPMRCHFLSVGLSSTRRE